MKLTLAVGLAAVAFGGLAAAPLRAQEPLVGTGRATIRIVPRVGLLSPDTYLYEQYTNFSGDGPVEWTNGYLGRALVLGVGFEASRTGGDLFLRGEILRSFDGWLSAAHSVVVPRQLFEAPFVQTTWVDVPTAVTMTSVQIVLPTRLMLWRTQPYVLAGVAGKHYDFGEPTRANESGAILPENGFTWGADVGAGFTLPVAGLLLDFQVRDTVNRYWGKTEHDLVFSTGSIWRVR